MKKVLSTTNVFSMLLKVKTPGNRGKLTAVAMSLFILAVFSGCTMFPTVLQQKEPGTVGFYEIKPVEGTVVIDNVIARRMSTPGDCIYVYRVDDDMVVLGKGNTSPDAKIKPLDEVTGGVAVTNSGAKQLAAYLEKVVAQYDSTEKKDSLYIDFQFLTDGEIKETKVLKLTTTEEEAPPVETKYIRVRFQYIFNNVGAENNEEKTLYYLGGNVSGAPKELTYTDIKTLISNLKKE